MSSAGASVDLTLIRLASLLESDPVAVARGVAQILRDHPGHPQATMLLGRAQRACGDGAAALTTFAQLAATQPGGAVSQLELGRSLRQQRRDEEAMAAFARATELQPALAQAWHELSMLHAARGETAECDACYARFASLVRQDAHLAEAAAAIANGRLAAAESLLQRALAGAPHDVAALRMLAEVATAREDYAEAERLLTECLGLAPGYSRARVDLVRLLYEQQKAHAMLPLLERLLVLEPDNVSYRRLQALAYAVLGQNERAANILVALLAEFPRNEAVWLSYGHTLRAAGQLEEAIRAYRTSAELKPQSGDAWFSLANLKTVRFTATDVAAMRTQLALPELPDGDRVQFEFALGKALEDSGDFAESFAHYASGNSLRRAVVPYDPERTTRLVHSMRQLYSPQFFDARAGWGCQTRAPIFIVGLPRSGSTLIEQILASHSEVEGTRELPDIIGFALELGLRREPGAPGAYPQSVAELARAAVDALGERYLAQTRPHRLLGRPRFIDKMPLNFLHTGLIHLLLPNARIIDVRRAPLACCFANFKQHFHQGLWFTYSLEDLGRYYRDYVALMAHFDSVLAGRIHRVRYEALVADLEGEVGRLLEYCGLPFEERCLRFHETRRVVHTVSSEQVRRPLYAESVDQWRNFEPWLGPLKEALGELAEDSR